MSKLRQELGLTEFARLTSYIAPIDKPIMLQYRHDELYLPPPNSLGFNGLWRFGEKGSLMMEYIRAW
jgi:hypothetical protein